MHHGFHTDLLPPPLIAPPKIQLERERGQRKLGKPDTTQSLKQRKGSYNNKQSALARMGCCGSTGLGLIFQDFVVQTGKETQTDLDSFFSPGRKELERENHTVVRQPIVDLVDNLHASLLACCCYCCCTSSSSSFSFPALLLSDFCHGLQRHSVRKTTISEELKQRPPKSLLEPIGQDSNPSSSREHNASEIRTSSSKAQTHTETHKKTTITKPRKKETH
jgi:hypothetical protein